MRASVIFGLGCSAKNLNPFQIDAGIDWRIGMPAASDEAEVILIFGGDGTIHRHLSQLVRLRLPVLVVPAGSGNDFARALGLHRVRDSLAAWQGLCQGQGNVREIDMGLINPLQDVGGASAPHEEPRYFCCAAGVGLDAEVSRRANRLPRWVRGHGGYALSLISTAFRFTPQQVKIMTLAEDGPGHEANWKTRSNRPTILAAFANTPTYGGGMKIAPHARL